MKTKEIEKSTNTIYNGKIFTITNSKVALPDGSESDREIVHHDGGASVLAYVNGKVLFVSQFRFAFNKDMLEIPAGKRNKGETAEETAIRELKEETGLIAKNLTHIFSIEPTPGYSTEIIDIFYADKFEKIEQNLDKGEFLNLIYLSPDICFKMVDDKSICDGKTVIALQYLKNKLFLEK